MSSGVLQHARPEATTSFVPEMPSGIPLELLVTDQDCVKELASRPEGHDRDEYALGALRVGLLSLRHARGQLDTDAVKREGDRLLGDLKNALESYRAQLHEQLTSALKEYFDPESGRFNERVERLIKHDGDLERALQRQIGAESSELAKTLASHVGENSPFLKCLRPGESNGLIQMVRDSAEEVIQAEHKRILSEFSLDNKDGALCRLLSELAGENGRLQGDLTGKIDEIVKEFSLDNEDSALSRLVRKVENAQQTISMEFSLDNSASALSRMSGMLSNATDAISQNLTLDNEHSALARLRRELLDILKGHQEQTNSFQVEIKSALESMKARREESLRSTTHGKQFEEVVVDFVQHEATKATDIATATGNTTGAIRYCKVGDAIVELGPESAAAGERFVVEAKEDASYDLRKALSEIETARQNRRATVGLFVFSVKTARRSQEPLLRYGNDVFVIWDSDDPNSDVVLRAGLFVAKALCVREARARAVKVADFEALDSAILGIESESKRLAGMKTWVETIRSNSAKLLGEIRKMAEGLDQQIDSLRDAIANLKHAEDVGTPSQ